MSPVPVPAATENTFTQSSAESAIAAIWSRILGVQGIGARDNFFDLGGHSLLAVQAHREIRADLGVRSLSITDIFRFPVLSALAGKLVGQPIPDTAPVTALPAPVAEPSIQMASPTTKPAPQAASSALTDHVPVQTQPVSPPMMAAPRVIHPSDDRATFRTEAMQRRRQLRAERLSQTG
jgi:hypothetical protein